MQYITSPGLISFIAGSLCLLTILIQLLHLPLPASVKHTSGLFFYEFICLFWAIIDLKPFVSACYTTQWFGISNAFWNHHQDKSSYDITIQRHCTVIGSISHTAPFILGTHLFCTFQVPSPISSLSLLLCPLATTCLFSVSVTLFLFCYVSIFVLYCRFHM